MNSFNNLKKIGDGKIMSLTEQDHTSRYEISENDIKSMQNIIENCHSSAKVTKNGYQMFFEVENFAIYYLILLFAQLVQ